MRPFSLSVCAQVVAGYRVPLVPARRDVGPVVAVQVLPEEGRPVALLLDPGGHRRVLVAEEAELLEAPERRLVVEDLVVVGVLAPQDGGPAGTAQRVGDEGVLERRALLDEQLPQVGHVLERVRVQVGRGQIVGEDQDHVGGLRFLLGSFRLLALRRRKTGGECAGRGQPQERVDRYREYSLRLVHCLRVRIAVQNAVGARPGYTLERVLTSCFESLGLPGLCFVQVKCYTFPR